MSQFIAQIAISGYSDQTYNLFFRPKGLTVFTPNGTFSSYFTTQDKYMIQRNGTPTYSPGGYEYQYDTLEAALEAFEQMQEDVQRLGHALGWE